MATSSEFARSIKAKYPQYQSMDDSLLTQKVLQKYPQYQSKITEPKKDGLIKSAVKGFIRPAVNVARDVGGGLYSGGAAIAEIAQRLTVDPQNKSKTFDKEFDRGMSIATPKGREALLGQDIIPSKQIGLGAQRGAGVASYLVPGGKTLKAAAGLGAASGALYGASEGDNIGQVAKNIAGGTLGGGVGGVVAKGAGQALTKVGKVATQKLPAKLMNTVFREPLKDTRAAIKGGTKTLGEQALEKGERGLSDEKIYQNAVTRLNQFEDELQTKLATSKRIIPIGDLKKSVAPLVKKYQSAGNKADAQAILGRIDELESFHGKNIPVSSANEIKRTLYDEARNAYGKQSSEGMEGIKALAKALKESIAEKVPGANEINKQLSYNGRIADSLVDKMAKGGRNNVLGLTDAILASPVLAAGPAGLLPVVAKKIAGTTAAKTGVAQGLKNTGEIASKLGAGKVLNSPMNSYLGAQVGQRMGVGLLSEQSPESSNYGESNYAPDTPLVQHAPIINPMSSTPQQEEILSPGGQWKWDAASNDWIPNAPQQGTGDTGDIRQRIYQLALKDLQETGGKNFSELKQLAEFYDYANPAAATEGKAQTEGQVARQEISTLTSDAIGQLKQTPNIKIGILAGPTENLKAKFDRADPATYTFNITLDQIRGAIAKARAGSAMSPQELALLDAYTPKVGDSRQEVVTKLMNLQKNFGDNEAQF